MAHVLVIEDEPLLRRRITTLLTANGHSTVEAENGREAIDRLSAEVVPSLIILDMVMPDMNGWGFLDYQRGDSRYSEIPVVVISAYENMARSAKPNAYLPKPIKPDELVQVVNELTS